MRQGERHRGRTHVAAGGIGERNPVRVDVERPAHRPGVDAGHLVRDVAVHVGPRELGAGVRPQRLAEGHARVEQALGVGEHRLQVPDAQPVVLAGRPHRPAQEPVPVRVLVRAPEHHRRRAGPEGQGGELGQHVLPGGVGAGQPVEGDLVGVPGALPVHHQRVVDAPGVDHRGGQLHAVEEAEAGVGQIEVHAGRRQVEHRVHGHRGGRLEVRPAHRGVDEQADLARVDARLGERLGAGHRRAVGEGHVRRPPAPFGDPGQPLQQPGSQPHPPVGGRQPGVELVGGHDVRGVHPAHRQDHHVAVAVGRVAAHALPLVTGTGTSCASMPGDDRDDRRGLIRSGGAGGNERHPPRPDERRTMAAAYPPSRGAHVSAAALPDDDRTVHAPDDMPTSGWRRVLGCRDRIARGAAGATHESDRYRGDHARGERPRAEARSEGFVVVRFTGRSAGTLRLRVRPVGGDVLRTTAGALADTQGRLRVQVRRRDPRAFLIGDRGGRAGRRSVLGVERLVGPLLVLGAETSLAIVIRRHVDLHLFGCRTGARALISPAHQACLAGRNSLDPVQPSSDTSSLRKVECPGPRQAKPRPVQRSRPTADGPDGVHAADRVIPAVSRSPAPARSQLVRSSHVGEPVGPR